MLLIAKQMLARNSNTVNIIYYISISYDQFKLDMSLSHVIIIWSSLDMASVESPVLCLVSPFCLIGTLHMNIIN